MFYQIAAAQATHVDVEDPRCDFATGLGELLNNSLCSSRKHVERATLHAWKQYKFYSVQTIFGGGEVV